MDHFDRGRRPADSRSERRIRFLGERDGAPEQQFKALVIPELAGRGVKRAYLARVEYDDPNAYEVALCIRGTEDRSLMLAVAGPFATVFGRDVHLDIRFVTDEEEQDLARVCRPFFEAG